MSVVHLVSHFPSDQVGGVGEVVARVHDGLSKRGHDSTVITTGTSDSSHSVHRVGRHIGHYLASSLRGYKVASNADVVHAQHGEAFFLLCALRLRRRRPAIVLTLHGSALRHGRGRQIGGSAGRRLVGELRGQIKFALDRMAMRLADSVTFISSATAEDILGSSNGVNVVGNGAPLGGSPAGGPGRCEVLFVGRPAAVKRLDLLPAVLEAIRENGVPAHLRLVGFHLDETPKLAQQFRDRGLLDYVSTEGSRPSSALREFYEGSGVLLLASDYEGQPLVILEAFAAGLPAVATDVGSVSELVQNGKTGYVVPAGDSEALAQACSTILADGALRQSLGETARQYVIEEGDVETQIDNYVAVYHAALRPVDAPMALRSDPVSSQRQHHRRRRVAGPPRRGAGVSTL